MRPVMGSADDTPQIHGLMDEIERLRGERDSCRSAYNRLFEQLESLRKLATEARDAWTISDATLTPLFDACQKLDDWLTASNPASGVTGGGRGRPTRAPEESSPASTPKGVGGAPWHPKGANQSPPLCRCGQPRNAPYETVVQGEVERSGWKCVVCQWWNWSDAPSPASRLDSC